MNIPLVSEYKTPFILHRIIQTFFGGFELTSPLTCPSTSTNCPLIKLFIFLFPSILGIVSTVLIDNHVIDSYIGVLMASMFGFLFTLSIHVLSRIQPELYKTSPLVSSSSNGGKQQNLLQKLIPAAKHKSKALVLAYCLMTSSLIGLMVHTFKLKHIKSTLHTTNFITVATFSLVWFALAIAHHSLTLGPPPETATFSTTFSNLDSFNRPVHLLLLPVIISVNPYTFQFCTLIICLLPFLWLLGVVPPISALFGYLLERVNVIFLGGTCSHSTASMIFSALFSLSAILLSHLYIESKYSLLATSLAAFLVSNKWLGNFRQFKSCGQMTITALCLLGLLCIFYLEIKISIENSQLFTILVTLLFMVNFMKYSERVYLLGKIKNPLNVLMSNEVLQRFHGHRITLYVARLMLHVALPLVALLLVENTMMGQKMPHRVGKLTGEFLLLNTLVFRLLRRLWQSPHLAACQLVFLQIIDFFWPNNIIQGWPIGYKHFGVDLMFKISIDFLHKLYLVTSILLGSVFIKKQRLDFSWTLFVLNLIIFPFNLLVIVTSSVLNVPILPLFTLPIYLLSFPRPSKFWSTTPMSIKNNTNDSAYYQQIQSRLIESLHEKRLFWDFCKDGDFFLARFDDRLMWLQVLESGHNYTEIQMKGLELQETSCHAIEASAVDHIIETAFGNANQTCNRYMNPNFFYTITPIMKVPVKTYSDAKNILTGIIDSPETYMRIKAVFCQVFIWVLLQKRIATIISQKDPLEKNSIKSKHSSVTIQVEQDSKSVSEEADSTMNQFTYEQLQPNLHWSNTSYQFSKSKPINQIVNYLIYSLDWFQEVLKVQTQNRCSLNENELQSLTVTYRHITNVCFTIIFPTIYSEVPTAQSICQLFNGDIIKDEIEQKFFDSNPDLFEICITSFQYTTKIAFDQIIFSSEDLTTEETITALQDFDLNWFFGNQNQNIWKQAVIDEKKYLFSIAKDMMKENYTSHLLTLQETEIYVCSLNRPMIEAIWSTLALELFYLTNDDEERYSIQAHSIILRNLTVQAADLPLGYPVFASKPILINHLT